MASTSLSLWFSLPYLFLSLSHYYLSLFLSAFSLSFFLSLPLSLYVCLRVSIALPPTNPFLPLRFLSRHRSPIFMLSHLKTLAFYSPSIYHSLSCPILFNPFLFCNTLGLLLLVGLPLIGGLFLLSLSLLSSNARIKKIIQK